ncbi:TKL/DRK protein kinase [Phytophthora nicotianae INRA-310]|uniref:TKL/DRK protein kinase n=4 Tax=Phytophthora nicotianae TaxID=4792 RepID=W2PIU8_PHYN3|nr:TKL/DRK protein kinase [Phytophthora nicotianae INRA-310]ETM99949.1 TKL/DRK protein kinase [Phytophthora nicotianae INRA-310]
MGTHCTTFQQSRLIFAFIWKLTHENVASVDTQTKMPHIVVDTLDIAIEAAATVSLMLGSMGFGIVFVFRRLDKAASATIGGSLIAAIVSRIVIYCIKDTAVGIITCAVTSAICIFASIYAYIGFNPYSRPSLDTGVVITIVFSAIELAIVSIAWWKRLKNEKNIKHENLVEDGGADGFDGRYECHQSPVANNDNSNATSRETRTTRSNASRYNRERPRSKVNLWDDDVITTARIPKEKIEVENLISQGGYGEVYKGTFNGLSVAVKMMLPAHRKSVAHVNNFLMEVKLIASLDHPRIVQFVGVAWDSLSDVCAVIEFMDGGDLRGLLTSYHNQHHPVGFNCAKVKIALHIAHALTYLHSLSPVVIHRDLKSRNILLTTDLDAKLTDFGVSRERADHTMTAGVGTSLWMAPEVLMGERYDDKADIFSFGVVLSELDLQVLPYAHATESDGSCHRMRDLAILQRMAMGKLRVQFSRNALASMVDVGVACVSLDPKDRPTAAEVLYRLQTIQRDELLSV